MRPARALPSLLLLAFVLLFAVAPGCGAGPEPPAAEQLRQAFPAQAAFVLSAGEAFLASDEGFVRGFTPANEGSPGLEVRLPRDAAGSIRLRTAGGFEARVRELGAEGESGIAESAVTHRRAGGASFWASAPGGVEEWLHLEAGVARRDEPVAAWEVEGGELREDSGAVDVVDAGGTAQIRVTAPKAYAEGGRPVAARLSVRGRSIELSVDADREAVLVDPAWTAVAPMGSVRAHHIAALLPNGKVLVAGGSASTELATAEIYDPALNTWSPTAPMSTQRSYFGNGSVRLASGKILVAGGYVGGLGTQATSELYDATTGTWSSAGLMATGRDLHTLTLLTSGKALAVAGRTNGGGQYTNKADLYDPLTNSWTAVAPMVGIRHYHAAALLGSGNVLVMGGLNPATLATAEIYDPVAKAWTAAASMAAARANFAAIWMPSVSKVMVCGGTGTTEIELYDPVTNTWSFGAPTALAYSAPTATLLSSGKVLVTGSGASQIYDPVANTWTAAAFMVANRSQHTATLLGSGTVLVAGGNNLATAEIFVPLAGGVACTQPGDCLSGFCVDGLCCNTACKGLCQACSAAKTGGANGTCGGVVVATDPDNECAAQAQATCGTTGSCDGAGKCQLFASGLGCAAASCSGSTFTSASLCNGTGTCVAGGMLSCAPYVCGGNACLTKCTVDTECTAGNLCIGGTCGSPLPDGSVCLTAGQCQSGNCVDGVCCDTVCNGGACDACSVAAGAPTDGMCALLTGTKCDDGKSCTQTDVCTAGVCGGTEACAAIDACHTAGACDAVGACTTPLASDGTACIDKNGCTQNDTCQSGKCVGGPLCPAPDACHVGSCNALGLCDFTAVSDGTACDDGDLCTQQDACTAGVCAGATPIVCPASDKCHVAGTCAPLTGVCSGETPTQAAMDCKTTNECETSAKCDGASGVCVKIAQPDGTPCGGTGTCLAGACDGGVSTTTSGSASTGSTGSASTGGTSTGTGSASTGGPSTGTGAGGSAPSGATGTGGTDGGTFPGGGCGCTTVGASESRAPWLLFGLLLVVRRRRRQAA